MEFTIQNIAVGEELHSVNVFFGTKVLKQKASISKIRNVSLQILLMKNYQKQ